MTADPPPPAPATGADDLQFDRAESAAPPPAAQTAGAAPAAATTCAVCHQSISDSYFEANGKIICPRCREMIMAHYSTGSPIGRFFKATALGIAAGAVGAAIWWGVRKLFHDAESGIVAIVVGLLVGGAVRRGSGGRGGRGYQVLAVVLTYLAVSANYVPDLYRGALAGEHGAEIPRAVALVVACAFSLAVPFLTGISSIIGLLIIAFALWEAWRINRHRPLVFNGPYRLPPGVPPPMPAAATVPAP
jgi:hypothetical protein